MGDDFIDSILEMGCQLAKHRKAEVLSVNEIIYSMGNYLLLIYNLFYSYLILCLYHLFINKKLKRKKLRYY